MLGRNTPGMRLGRGEDRSGAWLTLWGSSSFCKRALFERWWQAPTG